MFVRSLDVSHAWTTVFWRSIFATISLSVILVATERDRATRAVRNMGPHGLAVAGAFAASSIAMVVALTKTSTAVVLVIFALSPLVAAVLAWLMIGEHVPWFTWLAIAVTVAGVAFMVSETSAAGSAVGALIALVIPLAFGFGTVVIRSHPEITMIPSMLVATALGAVIAWPFAHPLAVTRHDLLVLMGFGGLQLGVGLALFLIGSKGVPASQIALLAMLEPIAGPMWVWWFKSEYPGRAALIGGAAVFIALAMHTIYAAARANRAPTKVPVASAA